MLELYWIESWDLQQGGLSGAQAARPAVRRRGSLARPPTASVRQPPPPALLRALCRCG